MSHSEKLTVPQKILLAGAALSESSKSFSAEDLIVVSWQMYPDTFGLTGYADKYPDSNRILTNIMGTKGMRGKGWLQKTGEKQYRLTAKGLADAQLLNCGSIERSSDETSLRAELDRRTIAGLERIFQTAAARKVIADETSAISFYDACGFWDITARSNANTLTLRLAETELLLNRAIAAAERGGIQNTLQLSRGTIAPAAIRKLKALHERLQESFKTELDVIRKRSDERLDRRRKIS